MRVWGLKMSDVPSRLGGPYDRLTSAYRVKSEGANAVWGAAKPASSYLEGETEVQRSCRLRYLPHVLNHGTQSMFLLAWQAAGADGNMVHVMMC